MHTLEDAINLMGERPLEVIGRLLDAFLMRTAAGAQVWPFERQVPEKLRKELEEMVEKFVPLIEENGTSGDK